MLSVTSTLIRRVERLVNPNRLIRGPLSDRPSDAVVTAVAANNIVTLRHDHDLFDSLKKIKSATTPATEGKLSTAQKRAIHINHCLVLLKMNKVHKAFVFLMMV